MVCLDSDILIAFLRGDGEAMKVIGELDDTDRPLKTPSVNEYELLKGAVLASNPEANLRAVRRLLSGIQVLTLSDDACEVTANIYPKIQHTLVVDLCSA